MNLTKPSDPSLPPGAARCPGPSTRDIIVSDGDQVPGALLEERYEFLGDEDIPFCANAWIDDRHVDGALWKPAVGTAYPEPRLGWPLRGDVVREVDNASVRKAAQDYAFHHGRKRPFVAKISRDRNDA